VDFKKNQLIRASFVWLVTDSCMRRAGFTETRSHPPLLIFLKPTTLDAGSQPAWRIQHVVFSCFISSVRPCVRETFSLSKFGRKNDMYVCLMCMALFIRLIRYYSFSNKVSLLLIRKQKQY
jgi:hypothetical protein